MASPRQQRNKERRARHRAMWAAQAAEREAAQREAALGFARVSSQLKAAQQLPISMGGGDPVLSAAQRLSGILSVGPAEAPYRTLGGGL